MHALYLMNEKDAIASAAMIRAMDTAGDYWKENYFGGTRTSTSYKACGGWS